MTTKQTQSEPVRVPTIATEVTGRTLSLNFSDGSVITVNADELTAEIREQLMLHGLKQKLVDAAAISRNPETGRSATVEDKFAAVLDVTDRLKAGEWSKRRESGEPSTGGLLFKALCELYANKTPQQIRDFLATKDKEQQAALRKTPKIAEIIIRLQARSAKSVDASALLAGLDD